MQRIHIIGAGFMGTALATAFAKRRVSVRISDCNSNVRASGAPAVLLTPITARQARLPVETIPQMKAATKWLDEVHAYKQFFMQKGVLRPSVSDYFNEFFSNSVQNNVWPEDWMDWWDAERVARFCSALRPTQGGIWFHIGRGLDGAAFLYKAREYAASLGAQFDDERVTPSDIPEPGTLRIFTNGYDKETWRALAWLRLHPVKGQMDCYEAPFELQGPISADGYAMTRDGFLFCGSTYEHTFTELGPTFQASLQLRAKMQVNYAYPMMEAKLVDSWTGVRVSTPDRKPVIGEIPGYPGRWIATGLGSKGLLMSSWLAEMLSGNLLDGIPLHPEYAIARFKKRWSNPY